MIKDKILNDVMRSKMGGGLTVKIEIEPAEKNKENDELKKEGLAPSLPEKDDEVKRIPGQQSEDDELADHFMKPEEQAQMQAMAAKGQKPKGIQGKAEQLMATKKIANFTKDGNA